MGEGFDTWPMDYKLVIYIDQFKPKILHPTLCLDLKRKLSKFTINHAAWGRFAQFQDYLIKAQGLSL